VLNGIFKLASIINISRKHAQETAIKVTEYFDSL